MGGILVIVFYGLFWWFCLGASNLFINDEDPKAGTKRLGWFFALAAIPLYIYVYERSIYEVACWSADDYYPKEKIAFPKALLVYSESVAEIYSKYYPGYMVAPERIRIWKTESGAVLSKDEILKKDNVVYYKGEKLADINESVSRAIATARYGLFYSDEDVPLTTISGSRYYLYDFSLEREISRVESYSKSWSQSNLIRSYLLPYEFRGCGPARGRKYVLENTFEEWREN